MPDWGKRGLVRVVGVVVPSILGEEWGCLCGSVAAVSKPCDDDGGPALPTSQKKKKSYARLVE